MKKLFAILLSACLALTVFVGCSNSSSVKLQPFSVSYSDFKTNFISLAESMDKTTSEISTEQSYNGKKLLHIIVSTPGVEDTTVSCLVDENTDELYNINLCGYLTPYFNSYANITLESASITVSPTDLKYKLAIPEAKSSYNTTVDLDGYTFVYSQNQDSQSFSIRPQK